VEANRQRHQRTVNGFTIWCLNSLHKYQHYQTCRSFVSFLADTMNLQYSYLTAKRTRDFFEMIVRYINVLLLLLLLLLLCYATASVRMLIVRMWDAVMMLCCRWLIDALTTKCTTLLSCCTTTCPTLLVWPSHWCILESTRELWTALAKPTAPRPGKKYVVVFIHTSMSLFNCKTWFQDGTKWSK